MKGFTVTLQNGAIAACFVIDLSVLGYIHRSINISPV